MNQPNSEQADGVRDLERGVRQPVLRVGPAELGVQRPLDEREDLPVDVVDGRRQEQQAADQPAIAADGAAAGAILRGGGNGGRGHGLPNSCPASAGRLFCRLKSQTLARKSARPPLSFAPAPRTLTQPGGLVVHPTRPLISLFATACLAACTAGTNAPSPGPAAAARAAAAPPARRAPAGRRAARAEAAARRASAASTSTAGPTVRPPAACRTSRSISSHRRYLVVLDRSETMGRNLMDKDRRGGRADQVGPGDSRAQATSSSRAGPTCPGA